MSDPGPFNSTHGLKRGSSPAPFKKGFDPRRSPGGMTKAAAAMQRLVPTMIAELTHGGADLVYMLLRIAAGAEPGMEDPKSRAWAIRELLDRSSLGRPAMSVTLSTGDDRDTPLLDDRELTDEELRVLTKIGAVRPAPAKVIPLVPIPTDAKEVPGDGGGADGS